MRATRKLTQGRVDAARYVAGKPDTIWCAELKGFGLRCTPNGARTFIYRYRLHRRSRQISIGSAAVLREAEARKRAQRLAVMVLDGRDPLAERERERTVATVAELGVAYFEAHAHKRSLATDRQRWRDYIVPALGSRSALAVRRRDVQQMHDQVAERLSGTTANRAAALVSSVYAWAERSGRLPENTPNPARGVQHAREHSRDRWATQAEIRRLLAALAEEPDPAFRGFVVLALTTGCRKSELLEATWGQVDWDSRTLRLEATKAGNNHSVPLSAAALRALRALPRTAGEALLFPGARRGRPLNPDRRWAALCARAGIEDLHVHDLRRTCANWMAQAGASLQLVGAVLNHASAATSAIYARLADRQRVDALEQLGDQVLELAASASDQAESQPMNGAA